MKNRIVKFLFAVSFLNVCFAFSPNAQIPKTNERAEVPKRLPENNAMETRRIDLKGCIQISRGQQLVIKDNETYLKTIRGDASLDWCLKNLEKIDFGKHALVGIEINSGYCRIPLGLRYQAYKDADKKQYLLSISYIDPRGAVCRALSQYDLWLLVPKLPAGYEVKFDVKAK